MAAGVILGVLGAAFASSVFGAGETGLSGEGLVLAATRHGGEEPVESVMSAITPDEPDSSEAQPPGAGLSEHATPGEVTPPAESEPQIAGLAATAATADADSAALVDPAGRHRRAGLAASQVASLSLTAPTRLHPPMSLADIERAVFSRKSSVLADCAYTRLIAEDSSDGPGGDLVLGPCFGPARPNADRELAVPGTHRVGSVSCCRHHAFVERMTSASSDDAARAGLVTEAKASLAEGVLPPLFRLRADRAASRFLREETRGWESAGLDGSAGHLDSAEARHEWKLSEGRLPGGARRVTLESWVQPIPRLDPNPSTGAREAVTLRQFRMTLLIQAAPRGDVLESFEWLVD